MDEKKDRSLQERVERLEAIVTELQRELKQKGRGIGSQIIEQPKVVEERPSTTHTPEKPISAKSYEREKSYWLPENMRSSEFWLNKIGIGLILFGVAFLFKYSIDQGWLTPVVRVVFGILLGAGLIIAGLRISAGRKHFSQVLTGGGIATFYITGFAAFQLLSLISHPVAFVFMVLVTLLAFYLSLSQDGAVLVLIGVIGGLGTPFLLYTGSGSLPGLVGYTCLVIGGAMAIFFFRGWRSLLWTTVAGGWLVFLVALGNARSVGPMETSADQWSLQLGLLSCWLAFWALPIVREFVRTKHPGKWGLRDLQKESTSLTDNTLRNRYLYVLAISTPIIILVMSMEIWSLSDHTWGWITMFAAAVYGFISWGLTRQKILKFLSYSHYLVGAVFLTFSFYLLLHGDLLLFTLAVEAAALHLLARHLSDKWIALAAHILFGITWIWIAQRLFMGQVGGRFVLNVQAVTDLWVIGIATLVTIFYLTGDEKKAYFLFIHIAVLGWFLRELSSISNGQGYVTIAWGLYSVILLIQGLRLNNSWMRITAMVTLVVVVGKLFLVDLDQLETIWRILLFLGFGGLFLIVSYYFRALWKSNYQSSNEEADDG